MSDISKDMMLPSEWCARLSETANRLSMLTASSEEEILQIGSCLQEIFSESERISQSSSALVDLLSQDILTEVVSRLNRILDDIRLYYADSKKINENGSQVLENIQKLLNRLDSPIDSFSKMNKALRMLSISTKIESARMGGAGLGFVNLAMDVEKLSHQVSDKSGAIAKKRMELIQKIEDAKRKVSVDLSVQEHDVESAIAFADDNLLKVQDVNRSFISFGEKSGVISREVTANIAEIVTSQQLHDITRQKFEHICEAIEPLSSKVSSQENDDSLIVETGDVCELQEAQLKVASHELCASVQQTINTLREISSVEESLLEDALTISGAGDCSGASFVDSLKERMLSIRSILGDCFEVQSEMGRVMTEVTETVSTMGSFVKEIKFIGSEIDLIALNSQVKAVHAGAEGAALAVLAEAIKRLSDDALSRTVELSAILLDMENCTASVSSETDADFGIRIEAISSEIDPVFNLFGDINSEILGSVRALAENVRDISQKVQDITADITIHQAVRQECDIIMKSLADTVSDSRRIIPATDDFKRNLAHLEEKYTMESERLIHESVFSKKKIAPLTGGIKTAAAVTSVTSELGDNVELF